MFIMCIKCTIELANIVQTKNNIFWNNGTKRVGKNESRLEKNVKVCMSNLF